MNRLIYSALFTVLSSTASYAADTNTNEENNSSQQNQAATTLDSITVNSDNQDTQEVQNSIERIVPVGKLGVAAADVPFSTASVDKEFIEEIGANTVQETLSYSSGVQAGTFGHDTRADFVNIRGLDSTSYQDGLRSLYGFYTTVRTDPYTLESVEVLKGPASVLYGQSDLGGIVNGTSKKPQSEQETELWLQYGSYDRKQLAVDTTGKLTEDGKLLYRFVGLGRDSGTQVDFVDHDGYVFNPSITWKPTDQTELTFIVNKQENTGQVSAQFLPAAGTIDPGVQGPLDTSVFVGEPEWDRYDREKTDLTVMLDHQLNSNWNIASVLRHTESSTETREHWVTIPLQPSANGDAVRTIFTSDKETEVLNFDTRIDGEFSTGSAIHNLVVGIDRQDALWEEVNYFYGYGLGGTINLYNPVYGNLNTNVITPSDSPDNEIKQTGLYLVDNIEVGNTVISTALRYDDFKNTSLSVDGASDTVSEDSAVTGRLGFMYKFDSGVSPYISYSQAFSPNLGTDGLGNALDPTTGNQKEIGAKYLSHDQSLSVNFAYFDIEQENRVSNGLTPGGVNQLGALVDGFEIGIQKRWKQFEILANHTDLTAIEESTGSRLPYVAEKFSSLRGTYTTTNGITLGLGARYTGTNVGFDLGDGGLPVVPSNTVYDASIAYEKEDWNFSLNVQNLTDETYVSWCRYQGGDCGFGERRNVLANVRYKF